MSSKDLVSKAASSNLFWQDLNKLDDAIKSDITGMNLKNVVIF